MDGWRNGSLIVLICNMSMHHDEGCWIVVSCMSLHHDEGCWVDVFCMSQWGLLTGLSIYVYFMRLGGLSLV
jgi:hypothetical protein